MGCDVFISAPFGTRNSPHRVAFGSVRLNDEKNYGAPGRSCYLSNWRFGKLRPASMPWSCSARYRSIGRGTRDAFRRAACWIRWCG